MKLNKLLNKYNIKLNLQSMHKHIQKIIVQFLSVKTIQCGLNFKANIAKF